MVQGKVYKEMIIISLDRLVTYLIQLVRAGILYREKNRKLTITNMAQITTSAYHHNRQISTCHYQELKKMMA